MRKMTIYLIVLDCVFYLQYLAPTLMLNQFHFNIFLNGAVIESTQLFVFFIGYFTIQKVPCLYFLVFLWFFWQLSSSFSSKIRPLVLSQKTLHKRLTKILCTLLISMEFRNLIWQFKISKKLKENIEQHLCVKLQCKLKNSALLTFFATNNSD